MTNQLRMMLLRCLGMAAILWTLPEVAGAVAADADADDTVSRQLQSSTPRVVAEAYECDEYMQELSQAARDEYKPLGYEIRVCIRPVTPTRNRGVVMRSIDEFTWFKEQGSVVQSAVVQKLDVSRSLQVCIPGRVVCTLKTKLLDDFFYNPSNATVVGSGTVSMQVQDHAENPSIRRQLGADENGIFQTVVEWSTGTGNRGLQVGSAFGGFAGTSGVRMEFYVDRREPPKDFVPYADEDITSWWEDSPTWLKVLVIGGAIILFLMGCCLCVMLCWAVRECLEDEKNKKKELDDDGQDTPPVVVMEAPAHAAWGNYEPTERTEDADDSPPTDKDVCFDSDDHPGTQAMYSAVDKTLKKYPNAEYSPEQYRHIKKQLPGRRFFSCDDSGSWQEVDASRLAAKLQRVYDAKQREQQSTTTMVKR